MNALASTFRALGCDVFVAVRHSRCLAPALELAALALDDIDLACSRFRSDSDLSRANAAPGSWVAVDPLLVDATAAALRVARATDGLVDPLLGRVLVELGYDRDFGLLHAVPGVPAPAATSARPGAWRRLGLGSSALRVPPGTSLDLGATGKAFAADLVAAALADAVGPALVSVGGDLRVAAPDGRPWTVAVSERPGAAADSLVALTEGGLATSSTQVRRWTSGGVRRHHLLDPRTGLPADGPWRTVTAVGRDCLAANAATTAALVLGADAVDWLREHDVAARLVGRDGLVRTTGGWPDDADEKADEKEVAA